FNGKINRTFNRKQAYV
ncbi:hypothetical protein BV202_00345B, partial [Haemophilus influenzae]